MYYVNKMILKANHPPQISLVTLWSCSYEWLQEYIVWLELWRENVIPWHKIWAFKGNSLKGKVQISSFWLYFIIWSKFCDFLVSFIFIPWLSYTDFFLVFLAVLHFSFFFFSFFTILKIVDINVILVTTNHTQLFEAAIYYRKRVSFLKSCYLLQKICFLLKVMLPNFGFLFSFWVIAS